MIQKNADVVIFANFDGLCMTAGPYRIATEVRDAGYSCQVIDKIQALAEPMSFTKQERLSVIKYAIGPNTKVLGISSTFFKEREFYSTNFGFSLTEFHNLFVFIRSLNPNIKIVLGGAYAHVMDEPEIDVFMLGMADRAIVDYLKFLDGKNPFFQYSIENNKMVVNGDLYPFDFKNSQIKYHWSDNLIPNTALSLEIARGCVFDCDFCTYPDRGKNKNDHIKLEHVIREEILRNYHEFGITRYRLTDSTFNDNTSKIEVMADIAQSLPFKLEYACYLRIDLLRAKSEQYQLLKDSGLTGCVFGIETLNHASAKSIGKGLHPDKVIEELYNVADKLPKVGVSAGFICGLPHETKESMTNWGYKLLEADFPIDYVSIAPLFLTTTEASTLSLYKSTFEKDASKYYTWSTPDDWDNGHFNKAWANDFILKFDSIMASNTRQRWSGFNSVDYLRPWTSSSVKKPVNNIKTWIHATMIGNVAQYKKSVLSLLDQNTE